MTMEKFTKMTADIFPTQRFNNIRHSLDLQKMWEQISSFPTYELR